MAAYGHVVPFMQKHVATRGAAISVDNPREGATYLYPLLITLSDQDEQLVFDLARAVDVHYEEYKNADPGSIGWAMERKFPVGCAVHDGACVTFARLAYGATKLRLTIGA